MVDPGAALGISATLGTVTALRAEASEMPQHGKPLPYPDVADTSHATEDLARIVKDFFAAKSLHQGAAMVGFFAPAPAPVIYIDAGLGAQWPSQASLLQVWSNPPFSSAPPDALLLGERHRRRLLGLAPAPTPGQAAAHANAALALLGLQGPADSVTQTWDGGNDAHGPGSMRYVRHSIEMDQSRDGVERHPEILLCYAGS